MDKYIDNNISLEEWIRLNDIREERILDAADLLIVQEEELTLLQDKIEDYECLVNSLDIESIEQYLDELWIVEDKKHNKIISKIQTILDNFKNRAEQI